MMTSKIWYHRMYPPCNSLSFGVQVTTSRLSSWLRLTKQNSAFGATNSRIFSSFRAVTLGSHYGSHGSRQQTTVPGTSTLLLDFLIQHNVHNTPDPDQYLDLLSQSNSNPCSSLTHKASKACLIMEASFSHHRQRGTLSCDWFASSSSSLMLSEWC